jgi:non-heme Fe2+,alpha-ketoglutarate-dependent halogenase
VAGGRESSTTLKTFYKAPEGQSVWHSYRSPEDESVHGRHCKVNSSRKNVIVDLQTIQLEIKQRRNFLVSFILSRTTMPSSSSLQDTFERDGFLGPLDILTHEQAETALDEVREELSSSKEPQASRFKLHLFLPTISAIAHHPALVKAVQQALGTDDILLWSSDINIKPKRSPGLFCPHQDSTFAGLSPPNKCLTAWVALSDPVGQDEGCLVFYKESHKLGQLRHDTNLDQSQNNMLSLGQYVSKKCLEDSCSSTISMKCVAIPLRAGQASFHNFLTVHQSGPNQSSNKDRVGLALRYMASSVSQSKPTKELVTLISGPVPTHFSIEPRLPPSPTREDIERGRATRVEAMRREQENYFEKSDPVQAFS